MLSQTKMQLWYPKKAPEEPPDYEGSPSSAKDEQRQKFENEDDHTDHSVSDSDISDGNEINVEFFSEDDSSRSPTPCTSYYEDAEKKTETIDDVEVSDFVDLDYWKKETICCGTIFRGMYDEILVDLRFFKPCKNSVFNKKKAEESS